MMVKRLFQNEPRELNKRLKNEAAASLENYEALSYEELPKGCFFPYIEPRTVAFVKCCGHIEYVEKQGEKFFLPGFFTEFLNLGEYVVDDGKLPGTSLCCNAFLHRYVFKKKDLGFCGSFYDPDSFTLTVYFIDSLHNSTNLEDYGRYLKAHECIT